MVIVKLYEGLTSEFRNFVIGYRMTISQNDLLCFDLSDFYNGSFWSYHLDCLEIPKYKKLFFRGDALSAIKKIYDAEIIEIEDGIDLNNAISHYNKNSIYYLKSDSFAYDSFLEMNNEYFYRFIGDDEITKRIFDFFTLKNFSMNYRVLFDEITKNEESVAVHIRLGDFLNLGWITEEDFDYYLAAIYWFRNRLKNPKFYVFSDNIAIAKTILGSAEDIKYVSFEENYISDIEELLCISSCKNKILSKKSTFSLLSVAIGKNKFGVDGINMILKYQHFSDKAGNLDYIEKNYNNNSDNILHSNRWLGNYIELDESEIKAYISNKYNCINSFSNKRELNRGKNQGYILFTTNQTYSKGSLRGMQYLAHYLALHSFDVGFVGSSEQIDKKVFDGLNWTIDNMYVERGQNSFTSEVELFPYSALNRDNKYNEFISWIQDDKSCPIVIINRKISVLPIGTHTGIYVFIDFTDPYEKEAIDCINKYSIEEINSLYEQSDIIVTFDEKVKIKYSKRNVYYIDLNKLYPEILILEDKVEPENIRKYHERVDEIILNIIRENLNDSFELTKA